MFYKLFYVTEQVEKYLTIGIKILWFSLTIILCEPPVIPKDICHSIFLKLLISIMAIGWWVLAYIFCEHPLLSSILFLMANLSVLTNQLSVNPKVRRSFPSGFSGAAYGNLLVVDSSHLQDLLQVTHYSFHVILLIVAVHTFLSLDPVFRFINADHQRVVLVEIIAHVLMGLIEPSYWILVIQNIIEFFANKDTK